MKILTTGLCVLSVKCVPPEDGVLVYRNMSGFMYSDCILCCNTVPVGVYMCCCNIRTYTIWTVLHLFKPAFLPR